MRTKALPYLRCPETGQRLTLRTYEREGSHVVSGLLLSRTSWYPVIHGVPRMLIGELKVTLLQTHHEFLSIWGRKLPERIQAEWQAAIDELPDFDGFLRHQKKTAESFAYEWKYIYKENDYERENFLHFLSPFVGPRELKGKLTVDIGCGSGRFTKWAAKCGTAFSFGTDLGETVEVAYELTKDQSNVCIVQADIYAMPFRGAFDLAYSIGVLHHLPKPQEGFSRLPQVLKRGGQMLIWVYNRRGNARAIYFYEPLRAVLKHLPKPMLLWLCYPPAFAVHLLNYLTLFLKAVQLTWLAQRVPFSYYANFPFNMKLNDAFDVLATPKSNYYYVEDVEHWFRTAALSHVRSYEHPEAGITCIGTKDAPRSDTGRKRVVHLIQSLNSGGCENLLLRTLPRLTTHYDQIIVTLSQRGELADQFEAKGIRVIDLHEPGIFRPALRRKLRYWIDELKPDLIMTYLFHADMIGRFVLSGQQSAPVVPYLVTTYNFWRYLPARFMERLTKGMVEQYLANSEAVKTYYVDQLGVRREAITTVPNGIDLSLFGRARGQTVRKELGLTKSDFVFTCVANLAPNKGHRYLLAAFERLGRTLPSAHLLIVGTGEQHDNLIRQAAGYATRGRIHFLGRRHDVPAVLAASDVFVLPTLFEGMSVAIVEAMAARIPVVTTDIPENRVLITHNMTGILVPVRSVNGLVEGLERLARDGRARKRFSEAAHDFVRSHLSIEAITTQWIDAFSAFTARSVSAPSKPRIVHLISSLESGGAENMLLRTLPLLNTGEYEHVVVTLLRDGGLAPFFRERGVPVVSSAIRNILDLNGLRRLFRTVRDLQPGLVITYLSHADQVGRLFLQRRLTVPVIPFLRTTYNYPRYLPMRIFERMTKSLVQQYLANSEAVRKYYVTRLGVSPQAIAVLPNGIDTDLLDTTSPDRVRRELKLSSRSFVIICVANFAKSKGHRLLLEAFEQFARGRVGVKLLLVGTGSEESALRQQAQGYVSAPNIIFLGQRDDVPALLAASDVFALPTYFEGMSNALLEAMAARLPVITTDIPENRVIIQDGEQGMLIPPGNVSALREALTTLAANKDERLRLGRAARLFIDRHLRLPLILKQWDRILRQWTRPATLKHVRTRPIQASSYTEVSTTTLTQEPVLK